MAETAKKGGKKHGKTGSGQQAIRNRRTEREK